MPHYPNFAQTEGLSRSPWTDVSNCLPKATPKLPLLKVKEIENTRLKVEGVRQD